MRPSTSNSLMTFSWILGIQEKRDPSSITQEVNAVNFSWIGTENSTERVISKFWCERPHLGNVERKLYWEIRARFLFCYWKRRYQLLQWSSIETRVMYTEVCEVVSRFPSKFDFEKLTFCFAKWCLQLALNITKNSQMSVGTLPTPRTFSHNFLKSKFFVKSGPLINWFLLSRPNCVWRWWKKCSKCTYEVGFFYPHFFKELKKNLQKMQTYVFFVVCCETCYNIVVDSIARVKLWVLIRERVIICWTLVPWIIKC